MTAGIFKEQKTGHIVVPQSMWQASQNLVLTGKKRIRILFHKVLR